MCTHCEQAKGSYFEKLTLLNMLSEEIEDYEIHLNFLKSVNHKILEIGGLSFTVPFPETELEKNERVDLIKKCTVTLSNRKECYKRFSYILN